MMKNNVWMLYPSLNLALLVMTIRGGWGGGGGFLQNLTSKGELIKEGGY